MPNPYAILAALGITIALTIGGYFYGVHVENIEWKAAYAAQQEISNTMLNNAYKEKADRERLDADNSRKVDEGHAQALAAANAGRDDFSKRLRIALSRKGGCAASSGQAAHSSEPQTVATGSDDGLGSADLDAGKRLRDAVMILQAYAKSADAFIHQCGR